MKIEEKRPAPYTICLWGAPGHVDSVYIYEPKDENEPYKKLKC